MNYVWCGRPVDIYAFACIAWEVCSGLQIWVSSLDTPLSTTQFNFERTQTRFRQADVHPRHIIVDTVLSGQRYVAKPDKTTCSCEVQVSPKDILSPGSNRPDIASVMFDDELWASTLRDLITSAWSQDPTQRPRARKLLSVLQSLQHGGSTQVPFSSSHNKATTEGSEEMF